MKMVLSKCNNKVTRSLAASSSSIVVAAMASSISSVVVVASFFLGPSASATVATRTLRTTTDSGIGINSNNGNGRIIHKDGVDSCTNDGVRVTPRSAASAASSVPTTTSVITTRNFSTTTINNNKNNDTTASSSTTASAWQPNQTTSTFTKMQSICPDILKAYATCVISNQNKGMLVQGVCNDEYTKLMDCFRMVRSSPSSSSSSQ